MPDMSGQNCLGSSENFGNCPKNRYSKDLGVGPIEDIYMWHMDKLYIYIYIYIRLGTIQIINHG
jgi:hypothetical protein